MIRSQLATLSSNLTQRSVLLEGIELRYSGSLGEAYWIYCTTGRSAYDLHVFATTKGIMGPVLVAPRQHREGHCIYLRKNYC